MISNYMNFCFLVEEIIHIQRSIQPDASEEELNKNQVYLRLPIKSFIHECFSWKKFFEIQLANAC